MKKKIAIMLTVCLILFCGVTSVSANVTDELSTGWHQLIDFLGLGKEDKTPTPEDFDEASLIEKVNYLESTVVKKSDLTELATKKDFVDSIPEEKDDTVSVINCEYTQYIDDNVATVPLPEKKADATQYSWKEIYNILTAHKAEDYGLEANTALADGWVVLEGNDYSLQICKHLDSVGTVTYDVAEATAQGYWSTFNANAEVDIASLGYLPPGQMAESVVEANASKLPDQFWLQTSDGNKKLSNIWYGGRATTGPRENSSALVVVLSLHGYYDSTGLPPIQQDTSAYTWEEIQTILAADAAPVYGLNRKYITLRGGDYAVIGSRHYSLKIISRLPNEVIGPLPKGLCKTGYLGLNSREGMSLAYQSQLPLPRDAAWVSGCLFPVSVTTVWTSLVDFESSREVGSKQQIILQNKSGELSSVSRDSRAYYMSTYWIGEKKDYLPRIKESTKYSWREISIILEEGLAAEYGIAKDGTQLRDGWITTRCRYVDGQNYLHIWKPTMELGRKQLYDALGGLVDKYNQEFGYPVVFDVNVPTFAELTTDALASYRKSASHADFWLADTSTGSTTDNEKHLYVKADGNVTSDFIGSSSTTGATHYVMPVLYLY